MKSAYRTRTKVPANGSKRGPLARNEHRCGSNAEQLGQDARAAVVEAVAEQAPPPRQDGHDGNDGNDEATLQALRPPVCTGESCALYEKVYRERRPVAILDKTGVVLTLVPEPSGSPDLVCFTLYRLDGTVTHPTVKMGRFEFELFARRLLPAPDDAPRYTPPPPKPLPRLISAQLAPWWSKRQAEIIAAYVATAYPYVQLQGIELQARPGRTVKRGHYVLVYRDAEGGVTLRAHAWRDIADHDLLRVHLLPPAGTPRLRRVCRDTGAGAGAMQRSGC